MIIHHQYARLFNWFELRFFHKNHDETSAFVVPTQNRGSGFLKIKTWLKHA
jgi:hypothetical protein